MSRDKHSTEYITLFNVASAGAAKMGGVILPEASPMLCAEALAFKRESEQILQSKDLTSFFDLQTALVLIGRLFRIRYRGLSDEHKYRQKDEHHICVIDVWDEIAGNLDMLFDEVVFQHQLKDIVVEKERARHLNEISAKIRAQYEQKIEELEARHKKELDRQNKSFNALLRNHDLYPSEHNPSGIYEDDDYD